MNKKTIERALRLLVGEKVTTSAFECSFYTSDFVPIPTWVKTFFETTPIAVVKPGTVEEVSGVMRYCSERGIPIVLRGGGISGLFGAVSKNGGSVPNGFRQTRGTK